jgi:hypothetical protein
MPAKRNNSDAFGLLLLLDYKFVIKYAFPPFTQVTL